MMNQNSQYWAPNSIIVTANTEELLLRRANDDHRIHYAHHVLYAEKGIRDDIAANSQDGDLSLRVARPGDVFSYVMLADTYSIKAHVEYNLSNIAKLRNNKELQNLKRVWLLSNEISEEDISKKETFPDTVIYLNPDATDINKMIKEENIIYGVFLVLEYESVGKDNNEIYSKIEWTLIAPGDLHNVDEYQEVYKEKEAEFLERLFYLRFNERG
jgi:hypothetical protein